MGIQLNLGDHISRFDQFVPFPKEYRADIQWARSQAKAIANTKPSSNMYFRSLPFGRTLSDILNDRSVWVNWFEDPYMATGMTILYNGKYDIGLSVWAFRSRQRLLATLIHELAHVGGAPDETTQAEDAVYRCGLGSKSEFETGIDDPNTPYIPGHRG
jgi:hypothetical protein